MTENTHPNTWGQQGAGGSGSSNVKGSATTSKTLISPPGLLWYTKSPLPHPPPSTFPSKMHVYYAGEHKQLRKKEDAVFNDLLSITSSNLSMVARKDLTFFRVGFTDEDAALAAVVTLAPGSISIAKAKEVAELMKTSLRVHGLADIEVAFLPATILATLPPPLTHQAAMALALTSTGDNLLDEMPPSKIPKVGSSLGIGRVGAGTLGCLVTVHGGTNAGVYGLTNCHVTLPVDWYNKPVKEGNPAPFSIKATPNVKRTMEQPAQLDVQTIISALNEQQASAKNEAEKTKKKTNERLLRHMHTREASSSESGEFEAWENEAKKADNMLQAMRNFALGLGDVSFTSGRRFEKLDDIKTNDVPSTLDWALIGLDKGRVGAATLKNEMHPWKLPYIVKVAWDKKKEDDEQGGKINNAVFQPKLSGRTRDVIPHFRKEETAIFVLKRGRSTGWTAGRLNSYQSYSQRMVPGDLTSPENHTKELIVVNFFPDETFSKPGDSGSVVFVHNGDVVGLLHGAAFQGLDACGPAAFTVMTPIDVVFKDIADKTKATKVTINPT